MGKNWFTIKKLYTNIWGIGEFNHSEKVISYLFVGENQALLFDTGLGIADIKQVVDKLTSLPVLVINSHHHWDHIGGNKAFSRLLRPLEDKIINIEPFELMVITTPGHTPDSICLYEKEKGLLFSGDTFYPGSIYLHFRESNLKDYKKTIKRLVKLDINWIFPGHNSFKCKPEVLHQIKNKLSAAFNDADNIKINRKVYLKLI